MEASDELVERVARAICCPAGRCYIVQSLNERAEIAANYDTPWPCCWRQYEHKARAALAAIPDGREAARALVEAVEILRALLHRLDIDDGAGFVEEPEMDAARAWLAKHAEGE